MPISFMLVDVHDNSGFDRTANSESLGFTPVQAIQVGREDIFTARQSVQK